MDGFQRIGITINLVGLLIGISNAEAQHFAHFSEFEHYITEFTKQQIETGPDDSVRVTISQVDKNMKLPTCSIPIETSLSQQGVSTASNSVKLECLGNSNWTLYIPVKISFFTNVLTAAHIIRPKELIDEQDVVLQKRDKFSLSAGYFTQMSDVLGQSAASYIAAGSILSPKSIKKVPLVKRNQTVVLVLKRGPIEINMTGVAKVDGYLHDYIKVLNPTSKKIVDGEVSAKGTVIIN